MSKLNISDKRLNKLNLSTQSILEIFYDCRVTDSTKTIKEATFYDESSSRKAPVVRLDLKKISDQSNIIAYLTGQLQAIHTKQAILTPGNGIINYNGQKWTEDNRALFALYYLATSCGVLNQFVDGEKYAYSDLTRVPPWLKPTFPPTDPRFKLKDAENALKDLGISIDGQSHVD